MNWYQKTQSEVENVLQTNFETGLTEEEANERLQKNGYNTIEHNVNKRSFIKKFLEQLNDFMVIVLIFSAIASFVVSYLGGEKDYLDSIIILAIVVLNAVLGVIQESKAEKAIEALKKLSAPKINVLREGKIKEIDTKEVVVGDIVILEAGDYVPADGRIIESIGLKAEESALTGESVAVEKNTSVIKEEEDLACRYNMVFSSTYITYGRGKAVITDVGDNTEVGKIAFLMKDEENRETPLQRRLGETGKKLGLAAIALCVLIFIMGIVRRESPFDMFMTSISLGVAAIPEGLPAIVTIVLALGMQSLSKKNTIVRTLPAVETLGSATVICSDKTGTLTQNKMKVIKVNDCVEQGTVPLNKRKFILMLTALCNDVRKEDRRFIGEPTEVALAEAYEECGEDTPGFKRVGEIPFSSERKLMSTLHSIEGSRYISVTKGAVEFLLPKCTKYLDTQSPKEMNTNKMTEIISQNEKMASAGLRVLAVGYKEFSDGNPGVGEIEKNLTFAGLIGIMDSPRPEVKNAVEMCKTAGIRPVMITGDNSLTAVAIGKQTGIFKDGDKCITGKEIDSMDEIQFAKTVEKCTVFSRVSPEHKMKIIKALQSNGHIVAMTGDGVNDAPALKMADIGCAMGKGGTEVAKGASDMILTDDNFATIVTAVKEGREIYGNIKKAVHFLLSSNIGELLTVFSAMIFGWKTPLLPIHLLWVNLVTDSLPAISLGLDKTEDNIMERPPIDPKENIFTTDGWIRIALEGCMIGMLAIIAFGIGHLYFDLDGNYGAARTMAFAVLSISQLVHAFNMRSEGSIFSIHILSNKYLVGAFILGVLLQVSVITIPPLAAIFCVEPLCMMQWVIVAILAFMPILIVELEKLFGGWNRIKR